MCSTHDVELVQELGADRVVNYTREDFTRKGERYDVVFGLVANRSLTDLRRRSPRATRSCSGGGGKVLGPLPLIARGALTNLGTAVSAADQASLAGLIDEGAVRPVDERVSRSPRPPR